MWLITSFLFYLSIMCEQDASYNRRLFDGVSLDGWEVIDAIGHGKVYVADSSVIIGSGEEITGIKWKGEFPKTAYEVYLEAKRVEGSDFFCGLTFPVKESFLTLVLGGWGGSVTGLSCIEGYDASDNETYGLWEFKKNQWYRIHLIVTDTKIEAWVDEDKIVSFIPGSSHLSLRWEVDSSSPFGITTYKTTGAVKNIVLTLTGR